jgi:SAM-dependent methyltransferase
MNTKASALNLIRSRAPRQEFHPMMAKESHDERARTAFTQTLRGKFGDFFYRDGRVIFENEILPALEDKAPTTADGREILRLSLSSHPFFQCVIGLRRVTQEILWSSVIDSVERQSGELIDRAANMEGPGSLTLDPNFKVPDYLLETDIHAMPGGYNLERCEGDITQGAVFDRGTFLYFGGFPGKLITFGGETLKAFIAEHYPNIRPQKILDMGCTVGHPATVISGAFPDAEVYGIDAGAPVLRYGSARAKALGIAVHFSQQNVVSTNFADESFDLIYSHLLFHEIDDDMIPDVMKECYRLLKPGGVMIHVDLPNVFLTPDPYFQYCINQDHYDNGEPFWLAMHGRNWAKDTVAAGFSSDQVDYLHSPLMMMIPPSADDPSGEEAPMPGHLKVAVVTATK